eukprot:NODE_1868_length_1046_cov_101.725176_g1519_i0.p1 GENE.NODE_1868_length_1046_cov_101.725176_g1519_i0~~NODE_1868_length_1046_cov_101.725176_g1519_i0.p1  ORF type:complete len:315 (+),score=87.03 NODE_1868_length_1046_cov_101.725176_g1519_i0:55-945(+)
MIKVPSMKKKPMGKKFETKASKAKAKVNRQLKSGYKKTVRKELNKYLEKKRKLRAQGVANVPPPERKMAVLLSKRRKMHRRMKGKRERNKRAILKIDEMIERALRYRKLSRHKRSNEIKQKRKAKAFGDMYVEAEPKVAFVVRIRGCADMPPKERKLLQVLRLRKIFTGVFVRMSKPTIKMLQLVGAYVAWGYVSEGVVRQLIYKRGYGKSRRRRIRLDNNFIERHLGVCNIICMEDLVHQIATCGRKFKRVNSFLHPFHLNPPRGGMKKKRNHFLEGGDAGNREKLMNTLVKRMV